jgi:Fe-S-cluster formation regulator IscX/YfhJ
MRVFKKFRVIGLQASSIKPQAVRVSKLLACGFVLLLLFSAPTLSQELNCKVTINADQIQTSDRTVFKDMERAIATFLNTRKWTSDTYKINERINCGIFLNISKMPSIGVFSASAQITVARPVYNSNYESVLLNFADRDWEFEYIESQPMEYNDNTYINNLTSMLAFYAYIILAMDYDSFGELGGNPYVQKALIVANNAQSSNRPGWAALGSTRSRYSLMADLNNPQMVDLRKNTYNYHRLALDTFEKDPDQSRTKILDALKNVKKVWTIYPSSILVISFFDTKSTELAKIFSEGSLNIRREAYDILTALDPKRNVYQSIISN